MKTLVFTTKGGSGKSFTAREMIAGPRAHEFIMVEIDELNKTQAAYASSFKKVVELTQNNIKELLILCNEYDDLIIDVGVDNISATIQTFIDYDLFVEIDQVVIPLFNGRTDCENALKSYSLIQPYCEHIKFILGRATAEDEIQSQFSVFFNNIKTVMPDFCRRDYFVIYESDTYIDAQNQKKLLSEVALDHTAYKQGALDAKRSGNKSLFYQLMNKELCRRAAQSVMKEQVIPCHEFLSYLGR